MSKCSTCKHWDHPEDNLEGTACRFCNPKTHPEYQPKPKVIRHELSSAETLYVTGFASRMLARKLSFDPWGE